MKIYETIQHAMDIYDEISILRHSIFQNLSIHWHLEFRYSIELFLMCHYYTTRSFARSFTFFIIFEKNAFFNVLYSYFSRSLHVWVGDSMKQEHVMGEVTILGHTGKAWQ